MAIPQRVWTDKKVVRAKGDDKLRSQVYLKDGELQYQDAKGHWIVAGGDLPPLNNTIEATSEHSAEILTSEEEDFILIEIETDPETGDDKVVVSPYGIFDDERYIEEDNNLWCSLFEMLDIEKIRRIISDGTEFPSEVFEALKDFYENPTEANFDAAEEALTNWNPVDPEEPLE